jgi:hypothetical protein
VEGLLTVDRTLLDGSGRRTVVEDATGAIEAYLPTPDGRLRIGTRVRLTGSVGRAWGAPRLKVTDVRVLGTGTPVARALTGTPTAAVEWRLVRVTGTLVDVHRSGDRWTADLATSARTRLLVSGLAGSGIAASAVVEGRTATVTGIVKRPYPTATDRRFAVVPRRLADLVLGAPAASAPPPTSPGATGSAASGGLDGGAAPSAGPVGLDVDLRDLAAHLGERVRVGGLVTELRPDGFGLDDGTAIAVVALVDGASTMLGTLEPGAALNATGSAEARGDATVLVVADAADVELVGALVAAGSDPPSTAPDTSPDVDRDALRASLGRGMGIDSASVGVGSLALIVTLSVLVTLARRHRAQRLLRRRIVARLDAIGRIGPPPS